MIISLVPIGNSKGIRLPKAILEQLGIRDQLDMEIENKRLILKPITKKPRIGWEEAFLEMHQNQDDTLLIPEENESEDFAWEW